MCRSDPLPGRRLESQKMEFDGEHFIERCGLFVIIALGETILTTGTAIARAPLTTMTLITGTAALIGSVAMWALTFGRTLDLTLRHLETSGDPVGVARHALNAMLLMVGGLIAVAVGNELVIAHPHEHASVAISLLLAGAPATFLVGQSWFLRRVIVFRSRLHLVGLGAFVLAGLLALVVPPYITLVVTAVVLSALAVGESHRTRQGVARELDAG